MKRFYYSPGFLCLWLLAACSAVTTRAQMVFSASVNTDRAGLEDQIQLVYTLQNLTENIRSVSPEGGPDFKDFIMLAPPQSGQSSQITVVGNQMRQSVVYNITYILKPKRTGTLTLPAGIATGESGHSYKSNAVQIEVVKGSLAQAYDPFDDPYADPIAMMRAQMQRQMQAMQQLQGGAPQQQPQQGQEQPVDFGKDLFIKVVTDKSKVHVGEQVTVSYKLYARIPMNMQISKLPLLNGFWTQDFELPKENRPVEEVIDGKKYQVFTLKKSALFPQQAGNLTLDPAEAQGVARMMQQVRQRNPFADDPLMRQFGGSLMMNDPFFNNAFFNTMAYRDVPAHIKSNPVKITVTDLPADGKPEGYGGAVGNFRIDAKMDKTQLTTDDAVNLKLTISGAGNLKLIETPGIKFPEAIEAYDPLVIDTVTGRTTTISGSKIISYPFSVRQPGDYEIPAITFSYYNPQTNSYTTLRTEPIRLHVTKGKNYNNQRAALALEHRDIHDIYKAAIKPGDVVKKKPMIYNPIYWLLYLLPLSGLLAFAAYRKREQNLSRDTVKLRSRKANKVALKRLRQAQQFLAAGMQQLFYEEVSKAIWLYLSDKLNIPLSELSRERAQEALQARRVPDTLLQQAEFVMQECEAALYMPGGGSGRMQEIFKQAVSVISDLEEKM